MYKCGFLLGPDIRINPKRFQPIPVRGWIKVSIMGVPIVRSRSPGDRLFLITSGRNTPEQKFLYCREACQMPETIKQEVLQLEPVLERYGACKFSHTFPMEKPFKFYPLKLPS